MKNKKKILALIGAMVLSLTILLPLTTKSQNADASSAYNCKYSNSFGWSSFYNVCVFATFVEHAEYRTDYFSMSETLSCDDYYTEWFGCSFHSTHNSKKTHSVTKCLDDFYEVFDGQFLTIRYLYLGINRISDDYEQYFYYGVLESKFKLTNLGFEFDSSNATCFDYVCDNNQNEIDFNFMSHSNKMSTFTILDTKNEYYLDDYYQISSYNNDFIQKQANQYYINNVASISDLYLGGYDKGYLNGSDYGYNRGLANGTTDGFNNGYDVGKIDGYNNGYNLGSHDGYEKGIADSNGSFLDGYNKGQKGLDVFGWFSPLFNTVNSFLSLQLFPNFTIGLLLLIPVIMTIFFFVFKLIRGG